MTIFTLSDKDSRHRTSTRNGSTGGKRSNCHHHMLSTTPYYNRYKYNKDLLNKVIFIVNIY